MRKLLTILFICLPAVCLHAQVDSVKLAKLESMLKSYYISLESEDDYVKFQEVDFILEACDDSLLRQKVAMSIFEHYMDSPLMGDESVAVHVFDEWFSTHRVEMPGEIDYLNASLFAEYNRNTLLGEDAPELTMESIDGESVTFPGKGRMNILFFYDTHCSKCKMETILTRHILESGEYNVDFYAIYVGKDREAWEKYVEEQLDINAPSVKVHHLWDPDDETDFTRLYGVLQTPRIYLTDRSGRIIGRRLTSEALKEILMIGSVGELLQDKCPVGTDLSRERIAGSFQKGNRTKQGVFRMKKADYVMFYTSGCGSCEAELEAARSHGGRILFVNVDEILAADQDAAHKLFENYDLSSLPYIIRLSKGVVEERYVTFNN